MASGFLQYFFRWISGGAAHVLSSPYRCEFAEGVAVGPAAAFGAEPMVFADAVACGPSAVFAAESCESAIAAVVGPEYAEGKPI